MTIVVLMLLTLSGVMWSKGLAAVGYTMQQCTSLYYVGYCQTRLQVRCLVLPVLHIAS
jgi:hypothetical protein